jgi:hypothetical protein
VLDWWTRLGLWWVKFLDGEQQYMAAVAAEKEKREQGIGELTDAQLAEYQAKIDAEDEKSAATIGQAFETVLKVGKLLGVLGIIGIMLTNPSGIFALLPFFVAIWGIQLLTKK